MDGLRLVKLLLKNASITRMCILFIFIGDTAQYIDNSFKILGRTSIDIIKTGGYKVSALFVETILLQNKEITDIAVVGLPDSTWGQRVGALIVINQHNTKNIELKKFKKELKSWAEMVLPPYSIPTVIKIVNEIPRNALGKVDKKSLLKNSFSEYLKI